jgi:predicted transcriptional regulator
LTGTAKNKYLEQHSKNFMIIPHFLLDGTFNGAEISVYVAIFNAPTSSEQTPEKLKVKLNMAKTTLYRTLTKLVRQQLLQECDGSYVALLPKDEEEN